MTDQHVPVERLAAYAAGDLDATAAIEVEAHVLLCADCKSDVEAVTRAAAALATVEPVTMPAHVAARIDAALAGPVGNVLPLVPKRRRPSLAGIAAVAAGIALLAAISVPLTKGGGSDGAGGTAAAPESARDTTAGTKRLQSALNYTAADLGGTLLRALDGETDEARRTAFTGGVDVKSGKGATETPQDSAGSPAPAAAAPNAPQALAALQTDSGRLAACIAALAEGQVAAARTPLLIDFAFFDDKPAMVVAFPTTRDGKIRPDRIDVWVVGPRCGITAGDDDVVTFNRFVRPKGL